MDPPECQGHSHDHDHGDELGVSLRPYIDIDKITCLNEMATGSGKNVFKLHENRLSVEPSVQSPGDDPELLFHIPFTELVTVHSITVLNNSNNIETSAPRRIKMFTNREDIDFDIGRELPAQQELELVPPDHIVDGTVDYPCRPAGRFQNISSLSIYVMSNYDQSNESGTEITHIGLKGKGSNMRRTVVEAVYESQGMPKDHQVRGDEYKAGSIL